jgi:hypothetical protein
LSAGWLDSIDLGLDDFGAQLAVADVQIWLSSLPVVLTLIAAGCGAGP